MNKTLNRLNKLIGMGVLSALLVSTAYAHTLAAGDTPLAASTANSKGCSQAWWKKMRKAGMALRMTSL